MGRVIKDFEGWARTKTRLQARTNPDYFYEREVWWAAIGHNLGDEEDGKGLQGARPVIIIRKFNQHLFWGVPTTSKQLHGKYYLYFQYGSSGQAGTALLSQLRVFDSKRLLGRRGVISETDFAALQLGLVLILRDSAHK